MNERIDLLNRMFGWMLPRAVRDAILGDLQEEYGRRLERNEDKGAASWWYCKEALSVIVCSIALHVTAAEDHVESRRWRMTRETGFMRALLMNVTAFAIFWVLLFSTNRIFSNFSWREAFQALATGAAILIAIRLRARVLSFFLAAMLAFNLAELFAHLTWGAKVVRGGETHFTVMGAGLMGVAFGALLFRHLPGGRHLPQDTTAASAAGKTAITG